MLTGDLEGSSRFKNNIWEELLVKVKGCFRKVEQIFPYNSFVSGFEIYRGDNFQCVLANPEDALMAAISLRCCLLSEKCYGNRLDARVSIGAGSIDFLPAPGRGAEGDGEAFRNSGVMIEGMKKLKNKTSATTPWPEMNEDLEVK